MHQCIFFLLCCCKNHVFIVLNTFGNARPAHVTLLRATLLLYIALFSLIVHFYFEIIANWLYDAKKIMCAPHPRLFSASHSRIFGASLSRLFSATVSFCVYGPYAFWLSAKGPQNVPPSYPPPLLET